MAPLVVWKWLRRRGPWIAPIFLLLIVFVQISRLSEYFLPANFMKGRLPCSDRVLWTTRSDLHILRFSTFLQLSSADSCFTDQPTPEFIVVVPDQIRNIAEHLSLDGVSALISLLKKHSWLQAASGAAIVLNRGERPACTMHRDGWTLTLSENYSKFEDGSESISVQHLTPTSTLSDIVCYPCDLLPDVFVIRTVSLIPNRSEHSVSTNADQVNPITAQLEEQRRLNRSERIRSVLIDRYMNIDHQQLIELKSSARIPIFLKLKGLSAYCHAVNVTNSHEGQRFDPTCNQLRMIWDGNYVLFPKLFGIYRLILRHTSDQSLEHWLGCTWDKLAHEVGSAFHCSNWVRQFLFDIVDILEQKLQIDYRLVFGSLLGAVRSGDVIPWSVDGDLLVNASSSSRFRAKTLSKLGQLSQWRYSHVDRLGDDHYSPLRAFPSCPVRRTSATHALDPTEHERLVSHLIISTKGAMDSATDWRSTGYVDLYSNTTYTASTREAQCIAKGGNGSGTVTVAGRDFLTVERPLEHIRCMYGETWDQIPPAAAAKWQGYLDDGGKLRLSPALALAIFTVFCLKFCLSHSFVIFASAI